jgi:outer membrane protein TolC
VGDPGAPVDAPVNVQTSTPPEAQAFDLPAQPLLDMAMANRTELLQTELELIVDALQIEQAQDATRPGLTATADYNFDGVGTEARRALRRVLNADFQTWSIGLAGEVPLEGNLGAQARLRQAMLTRAQRLASEQSQRQSVRQEVLDAIDRVNSAWQRILAAQQSALLAGETLDAERRQFEAGLRTSTDVLSAASSLADAQSQEVRALTDHRVALVDLAVATGTVLGAAGITWSHLPEPPLGEVTPAPAIERDPSLRPPQAPEADQPH